MNKEHILFVCTGNTCRSPMAKAIAEEIIQKKALEITVDSAGLAAYNGDFPSRNAVAALKERGIDLSPHRAKQITRKLAENADRILTMTQKQKKDLLCLYPDAAAKTETLDENDIPDPYGGDLEIYRETADRLFHVIEKRFTEETNDHS